MSTTSSGPRLLVLSSTYPRYRNDPEPGFVHELSRRLTRELDVHVLCPHAPGAPPEEVMDGVHVHRFRYAPGRLETLVQGGGIVNNLKHHPWKWFLVPIFLAALTWHTGRLIRRLRPDSMHVHWILPQGLAVLLAGSFARNLPPFLLTSHGGDLFGLQGSVATRLKRRVLSRADTVSVVSRPMADTAISLGADPERLEVIPMGVDFLHRFTPGDATNRRPGEILFVGRLVEKKGLRYLVEALPEIVKRVPDAHLTIAGYGPEETALQELVFRLGLNEKVAFLGALPQDALPPLYRRAAVFVAPFIKAGSGDQEGLPVALMEAIACSCPVVVSDLEVMGDIFTSDELDMRVPPGDADMLADRVVAVLDQPAASQERAERIRIRLAKDLSWDTISARYANLLRRTSKSRVQKKAPVTR
jgi:glycosyltransferase involved in cell wall biosynthesis